MLIADHFIEAEPVSPGSMVFKSTRVNGSFSAVQVFPFTLTVQQREAFAEQMILLAKATSDYRASIPELLSWGFTKEGDFPYIETEWINGVPLNVKTTTKNGALLSINDVMVMTEQVSRTLSIFEQLGLRHGTVSLEHILWESSRNRYVLVGFKVAQPNPTGVQHNDLHDFGQLLFQLLKGYGDEINLNEAIENKSPVEPSQTEAKNIPAWLINTTRRCLSPDPKFRFGNAAALYNYVLSQHTTHVQKKSWYRSKPQQDIPSVSPETEPTASTRKLKTEPHQSPSEKKKRVFINPYIVGVLLVVVMITAFSMNAYRKDRAVINNRDTAIAGDTTGYQAADTVKPGNESKKASSAGTGLGAYQVRSKAHFYNRPDRSARRNAFIVHWNKALLYPREEQNDFVYIVYTNREGQTSKGWLRKKDLVKVEGP